MMQKWYQIFPKNTGLSLYIWLIFCILPFYFIFRSSSKLDITIGIIMVLLFFLAYRLSFISNNWPVYLWVSIEMAISLFMTIYIGYVYFALFLAFFIGNVKSKAGFITLYIIHLSTSIVAIGIGFFMRTDLFLFQLPFIIISLLGIILLPLTIYNRNRHDKLENMLDDAHEIISQLLVMEERQRIARDLHDTLGQKLSMIGLKSDLAQKLIDKEPDLAKTEISDIQVTARTALSEVREMVSDMRSVKIEDEIMRIKQILTAAQIELEIHFNPAKLDTTLLIENVLSMCLKEAVTNVVKHSKADFCMIKINQCPTEISVEISDNGIGLHNQYASSKGHGLIGIKERLEFLNGSLEVSTKKGTTLICKIPNVIKQAT